MFTGQMTFHTMSSITNLSEIFFTKCIFGKVKPVSEDCCKEKKEFTVTLKKLTVKTSNREYKANILLSISSVYAPLHQELPVTYSLNL